MSAVKPFPVAAPIRPEERQIGRAASIDALEHQIVEKREHTLLIDERRVGKTSMVWAVQDRVRANDGWALDVNLARGPVTSSSLLAERLADQARAAKIRVDPLKDRILDRLRDTVTIVLVLAGSDRAGLEQLLADGQPLHRDGILFPVRPIAVEDWRHELPRRFAEVGLDVDLDRIDQILAASGGHPERTMRVCLHVTLLVNDEPFDVTETVVDAAISDARKHPSWRL